MCIRSYECLISYHYCLVSFRISSQQEFPDSILVLSQLLMSLINVQFCKKEKLMSLNRQFREIKFPANTVFSAIAKCTEKIFAKFKSRENKGE